MSQATGIKAYHRAGEFQEEILSNRHTIFETGFDIGFHSAHRYISLKKKFTSFLYAFPNSGKTSFVFDIYMHIARTYDIKIAIYSPEAGGKNHLVAYLVQVYLGKKLHGYNKQESTDEEWLDALSFIDSHFLLLAPKLIGKDKILFDSREMFNQIHLAQKDYDWDIELLLCDPYNQLSKSHEDRKKSISDFTLENLTYINQVAEEMDMHIQIAMHLRDEDSSIDKETGVEYMPKPFPNKLANGQSVWRVAQTMIGIHRLPKGMIEKSTGVFYPENGTDLLIQKNKIFGAGEEGTFRLHYDVPKQKFYEIIDGNRYYCGEYDKQLKNTINNYNMPPMPTSSWHEQKSPLNDKEELKSPF